MSVLIAKSSSEFRRPPMVQRNKGGLAKYLGTVSPNNRGTSTNDWEVRTLTMSPPATKKLPLVIAPRTNSKMDKKLPKPLPSLPISNDVLKNLPNCKISSLRYRIIPTFWIIPLIYTLRTKDCLLVCQNLFFFNFSQRENFIILVARSILSPFQTDDSRSSLFCYRCVCV